MCTICSYFALALIFLIPRGLGERKRLTAVVDLAGWNIDNNISKKPENILTICSDGGGGELLVFCAPSVDLEAGVTTSFCSKLSEDIFLINH